MRERSENKNNSDSCLFCGKQVDYTYFECNPCEIGGEFQSYEVVESNAGRIIGYKDWEIIIKKFAPDMFDDKTMPIWHIVTFLCKKCANKSDVDKKLFVYLAKRHIEGYQKEIKSSKAYIKEVEKDTICIANKYNLLIKKLKAKIDKAELQ